MSNNCQLACFVAMPTSRRRKPSFYLHLRCHSLTLTDRGQLSQSCWPFGKNLKLCLQQLSHPDVELCAECCIVLGCSQRAACRAGRHDAAALCAECCIVPGCSAWQPVGSPQSWSPSCSYHLC